MIQKTYDLEIANPALPARGDGFSFKSLGQRVYYRNLRCLLIDTSPASQTLADRFQSKFLNPGEILRYAIDSQTGLPEEFLLEALSDGDDCIGILDGKTLINYGWYSTRPAYLTKELRLHFGAGYVYTYLPKSYTHPAYHDFNIGSIAISLALTLYRDRGMKGLVAVLDERELKTLRFPDDQVYKDMGRISIFGCFGKPLIHCGPRCRELGISVRAVAK